MKIEQLACPSCGASLSGDFSPDQSFECSSCGSLLMMTDLETPKTILCPKCQTPNQNQMKSCSNCDEPLQIDCIMCHKANPVTVSHCQNCGIHLRRAQERRRQMLAAKQKQVKERQQARLEKEARQKQETLERLLEDLDEPENHDFAIYRLNQLGEVAIKPLIETLLQDDDPDARYGSARALGQICHEQAIKVLIKARAAKALMQALKDSEPAVRYWSAEALGKFTGQTAENAIDPLIPLLKDSHKGVAAQARRSLVAIGGPRAEEALEKSKRFFNWLK